MNKRDYIYYDFICDNIKPKSKIMRLYCIIRKLITYKESPSKIFLWGADKYIINNIKEALDEKDS